MFENADQSEIIEEDLFFPDDDEDTTDSLDEIEAEEEATEEDTTETEVEKEADATGDSLDELEIKFLHEVKKLKDIPKDELKTLVQKGMDYDRKLSKIDELKLETAKYDRVKELAGHYNMSDSEMIDMLFDNYFDQKANTEGLTKEIVKKEYELNKRESVTNEQAQLQKFVKEFPDIDAKNIPLEVVEQWQDGKDLTETYRNYLKDNELNSYKTKIDELEKQLKLKQQTTDTKKKAVVKATSTNGNDKEYFDELAKIFED